MNVLKSALHLLTSGDIANDQQEFLLLHVPRYVVVANIPLEDDTHRQQLRRFLYQVEEEWFQRWNTKNMLVREGVLPAECLDVHRTPTEEEIHTTMSAHRATIRRIRKTLDIEGKKYLERMRDTEGSSSNSGVLGESSAVES